MNNMTNDMTGSEGRFCNHILRALGASFIAKKQNLKFNYGEYYNKMKQLGINLYIDGTATYNIEQKIPNNIIPYISYDIPLFRNINVNNSYFQTKEFSNYLYNHYKNPINQYHIIEANKFKSRYNTNNDLFVHIRLGDVTHVNQGFTYYDKAISQLNFEKGYIASDSIDHETCKMLIDKYRLIPIDYDEVETIMFGSTCRNIILTGGSFSYIIGLFGFTSKVYYLKGMDNWYPSELFFIDNWTEISI
jgi:hypothetical protein